MKKDSIISIKRTNRLKIFIYVMKKNKVNKIKIERTTTDRKITNGDRDENFKEKSITKKKKKRRSH